MVNALAKKMLGKSFETIIFLRRILKYHSTILQKLISEFFLIFGLLVILIIFSLGNHFLTFEQNILKKSFKSNTMLLYISKMAHS